MLRVYQIITKMMIWTTQAQTGSTNLVGAFSLHQHVLPLFPSITSLRFLLSHPPPCLRPFSYRLFLKSSLDLIHIHPSICVSPCCSFSLHRCVGFLSALERRVLLLAIFSLSTSSVLSLQMEDAVRAITSSPGASLENLGEHKLHNLTRISQSFCFSPPTQHASRGGWRIYSLKHFKVNNWS